MGLLCDLLFLRLGSGIGLMMHVSWLVPLCVWSSRFVLLSLMLAVVVVLVGVVVMVLVGPVVRLVLVVLVLAGLVRVVS